MNSHKTVSFLTLLIVLLLFSACVELPPIDRVGWCDTDVYSQDEGVEMPDFVSDNNSVDDDETANEIIDEDVGAQDFAPVDDDEVIDELTDESTDELPDDDRSPEIGSMVSIPGNSFWQGCRTTVNGSLADTNCFSNENPYHRVSVPSFQIDVYEVTNNYYVQFLNANGNICFENVCIESYSSYSKLSEFGGVWRVDNGFDNYPTVEVTWYGAKAYCEWAGKRLPSESEWELAARGTDERIYPWGDEAATCDYAVMRTETNGCGTDFYWAVGSKPSGISPYGLFDMAGNVSEWVEDDWHTSYGVAGRPDDGTPWIDSPRGPYRMFRGGSWNYGFQYLSTSHRSSHTPRNRWRNRGFRCASE